MRYTQRWATPALASTLLIATWGCSEKPSVDTTTAEGTVSGVVTIRGKPMAGGEITFDPSNVSRSDAKPRKATIGPDGKYSVTTLQGRNTARISGPALAKEPQLGYGIHTVDVQPGDNSFDIKLPPD